MKIILFLASGEDASDQNDDSDSDGPSETVAGVKIKLKSKSELPPSMVEEADMGRLDKLDVPNEPLPEVIKSDDDDTPKSKGTFFSPRALRSEILFLARKCASLFIDNSHTKIHTRHGLL